LEGRELARGWLRDRSTPEQLAFLLPESSIWDAPLDADAIVARLPAIPASTPSWWGQPAHAKTAALRADGPQVAQLLGGSPPEYAAAVGSNNWAVAGSRSATGGAIVSDDMHLGINLPNIWYRAALQYPDTEGKPRRIVGVMLPGAPPVVVVGSNGRVAWGFTNSYGDYLDLVEVATDSAHPGQVQTPQGWETPRTVAETLLVKGAPAETLAVRETALGPLREAGGRTYALHWIAHTPRAVNFNARHLEAADNVDTALATAATMGIPAQNFVAGDAQGNIGWSIAGALPRRAKPDVAATFPQRAGDTSGWDGWLEPGAYPRIVNPAGGQLVTANSRQLAGADAAKLGDGGFDLGARAKQARDGVRALGPRTDEAGAYSVMLDDRAVFLAPWRDRALAALDASSVKGNAQRAEFLRLLQTTWTGRASTGSVAYRMTRAFMHAVGDELYGGLNEQLAPLGERATMAGASARWPLVAARLLDEQPAAWLPPRYANWHELRLAAIDRVIADLTRDGKTMTDATWGQRNTAAVAHPISMAAPFLKRWLAAPADALAGDNHMPRVAGTNFGQSERLTVTPGKEEQGVFNMPGGQSGHPLSRFFLAGHSEWVAGKPTPLLPGPAVHTLTFGPRR
ncbi:MAG TPA: penicillin acylase family protein, partial [Burkholderiaceae bacterium]